MIRNVDLVSYLPQFMKEYKEPVAALEAENPEFVLIWSASDRVLKNKFIETADEYGISRYERMLNIHPSSEDTLESRRSRIRSKWFNKIPYTLKVLLQKLEVLCDTDFTLTNNFTEGYTLTLLTDLELYGQVEELERIINTMTPCNIVFESNNVIPCNAEGDALFGGGLAFVNEFNITNDFVETYTVNSGLAFGGGIVNTDEIEISQDAVETLSINGSSLFGGGLVKTDMVKVTNDFSEIMNASGDAEARSGVVFVDFIEINSQ